MKSGRLAVAGVVLTLAAAGASLAQPAPGGQVGTGGGGTQSTAAPRSVNLADIPQAPAPDLRQPPLPVPRPQNGMRDEQWNTRAACRGLRTGHVPSGPPSQPPGSGAPDSTQNLPEDPGLAVGPSHMVLTTPATITVLDRDSLALPGFPKQLSAFLGLAPDTPISNPQVLFDCPNNRFALVVFADRPESPATPGVRKLVVVGISQGSDPTRGWKIYTLEEE